MKRTKKLLSLAITAALAVSMMAPAFAEDPAPANTMALAGSIIGPTISVASDGGLQKIVLNPYGLKVNVDTSDADTYGTKLEDQKEATTDTIITDSLIATPVRLLNLGDTDVTITPSINVTVPKGLTLATTPFTSDLVGTNSGRVVAKPVTTKSVFMYMKSGLCTWDATDGLTSPITDKTYDATNDLLLKVGANAVKTGIQLYKTAGTTAYDGFTGGSADLDGDAFGADGKTFPVCEFQIVGEANGQSATAWTTDGAAPDKVDVSITWTIAPTVIAAPASGS